MEPEIKNKIEISEYDALLAKLWNRPEGRGTDFKAPFVLSKEQKKQMYGLIKDILAMANTEGGGNIIIGKDNFGKAVECSQEVLDSFDVTKLHAQVKRYGRPEPKFSASRVTSPEGTAAILICVEEFEEHVIICAENAHDESNKLVLQAGDVYIRSITGNASSERVLSEQDMRSLIRRSMLKSEYHSRRILEDSGGGYFGGIKQNKALTDDGSKWQKMEERIAKELDATLCLEDTHLFQISAHPAVYDSNSLQNGKVLKERLLVSTQQYYGWSFPCPDFELREIEVSSQTRDIIVASSRLFQEGDLQSAFAFDLSGLVVYREQLPNTYDSATPGKPLLFSAPLVTLYRAMGFFGRFFEFVSGGEEIVLKVLFTDTHLRIPSSQVYTMYNHVIPFYGSKALAHPKVSIDLEIKRSELSGRLPDVFFKVVSKLMDRMEIKISDEQLMDEVKKITNLKGV